ncbi:unnamed protein product [Ambrosiozyma monospora]|uniref:Unnamed protein product n=1 Tax=Ambrosiozyma monospora TaxID=43982 RepID=A0A9W7DH92_AMBMO|nr:unnamed protein product [Ambrosiozyma monospora]
MALSYFIWDTLISLFYVGYFGVGFLVHGIVSTIVFTIGVFHPYIHYYCPLFLLFEISTPFLNVRWVGLKFDVLSESFKLVNNAILMLIFFFVRICWGWYQVVQLGKDFYNARENPKFTLAGALFILSCNFVLDILNVFWFSKMLTVAINTLKQLFGFSHQDDKLKLM